MLQRAVAGVLVIIGILLAGWAGSVAQEPSQPTTEGPQQQLTRLHQQVVQLYRQGHYTPALELALQARDLARQYLGEEHPEFATALDNLGLLYKTVGNYPVAEPLLLQALEIRRRTAGEESPDFVTSLNNLAGFYSALGRYGDAEQRYQRALDIVRTAIGEDNEYFIGALINLASLYKAMGHYAATEPLYQQALAFWQARGGATPPEVALIMHNLAELYVRLGRYREAEPLYKQALEVTRTTLGSAHVQYARSILNLAALYEAMGRYDAAEPLYQQAIELLQVTFSPNHPEVANALNNLAVLSKTKGDYARAETLYRQASAIWRQTVGEAHPRFAISLNNLGDVYYAQGKFTAAEPLYQQALAIEQQTLGPQHVEVATTLNNLAVLARAMGRYSEAEAYYRQALMIWQTTLSPSHPDVALALHNLGALAQAMGHYPEAEEYYRQALAIRRATLGELHPDLAASLYNLAAVYTVTSRLPEALDAFQQAVAIEEQVLGQVFAISSERQRMAYLKSVRSNFDALVSFVWRYGRAWPTAVPAGLDVVLRRKAIGAEALAVQRDALLGGKYPALEPQLRTWTTLRRQISRKRLDGPGLEGAQEHQRLLAEWSARLEQVEAELARHIPEMNLAQRLRTVDHGAVARALPTDAVLLEFVRFDVYNFQAVAQRGESLWQAARYVAFIMRAEAPDDVRMIDLGEAAPIERMLAALRASITGGDRQLRMAGAAPTLPASDGTDLRMAVFDPLIPALQSHTRLFIVPDGDLSRLPFEVLPLDQGRRLIDVYRLSYLSTGRDVLRFTVPFPVSPTPALVLADPDFDLSGIQTTALTGPSASDEPPFTRLPGTRLEGERIATLLGVQPWLERVVLEAQLKTMRAPRLLHIATHGFFLPASLPVSAGAQTGAGSTAQLRLSGQHLDNPLWRSGLALAGANTWLRGGELPAEAEDGILYAEDVSGLDLLGTELVVLSACETGLGEVQVGEGVVGLRRAFVLAGARTLVMSLWKVPDQQTQELMEEFYHRLLAGMARADALREAQLTLKEKYPTPLYWGAFISQGEPGALRLMDSPGAPR